MDHKEIIDTLEESGEYRVLRRLKPDFHGHQIQASRARPKTADTKHPARARKLIIGDAKGNTHARGLNAIKRHIVFWYDSQKVQKPSYISNIVVHNVRYWLIADIRRR